MLRGKEIEMKMLSSTKITQSHVIKQDNVLKRRERNGYKEEREIKVEISYPKITQPLAIESEKILHYNSIYTYILSLHIFIKS